jgi:hypothetical protein
MKNKSKGKFGNLLLSKTVKVIVNNVMSLYLKWVFLNLIKNR